MPEQLSIFHNTIHLTGEQLSDALRTAILQDHKVYVIMQHLQTATPSQVHACFPGVLLTSVRRSMSNLTHAGKLEKTAVLRDGPYGKPEHVWKLVW